MSAVNVTNVILPGKFDTQKDKWEDYREQLYFALEAAGIVESVQKRALFLSQCGKQAFSLIVSLLAPKKLSTVPFEEIIAVLDKFFIPKPHPILETEKFYMRKQKPGESVTSFIAALHDISSRCDFVDLQRRIGEQVILGTSDSSLKRELLKMTLSQLSYDAIVQQALNCESMKSSQSTDTKSGMTFTLPSTSTDHSEPMEVNSINTTIKQCEHCAKRHLSRCRFRNATCYNCHKKGHTKAACRSNKQVKMRVNECCEEESTAENENNTAEDNYGVHVVTGTDNAASARAGATRVKPYVVELSVNGVPLVMEVDSGSSRTILPYSVYMSHRDSFPGELSPCDITLVTWTNDKLHIKGEIMVNVQFHEQKMELPMLVSCGRGPALLGRSWFDALGISLHGVNSVTEDTVCMKYQNLFKSELNEYSGPLVHISLKENTQPVFQRARPVPFPLREKVNEELQRMVSSGILTPVKHASWATPLRIVPKPDGTLRLCGDYRTTVNASCLVDKYPLPTANEAFFQLSGGKIFTKLDLKHAYNQIKVDPETAELLTLNTPLGLMRMNRLAYGVNAATAIFQRLMSAQLAGIDGVACLLDDVVVSGSTREEHQMRLELVLQRLDEIGLKLNKGKCVFATDRVTFLGYEIDKTGVHPLREKIQEIADKPAPTDKRSLKAFLGLYNFYERFVKEKAIVLSPLYRLLKENVMWKWTNVEQEAFNHAKALLSSDLTLVHYSLDKELLLLCDASEYGVGAVLVHKMPDGTERPVIMGSRTLQQHERRYAQIDKEALAIIFGLKKFRQYLTGRKFTICTDHKPLLGIFGRNKPIPEMVSSRMLRWALILNTFDYDIQYRPGKTMGNADSLSRFPTKCENVECATEEVFLLDNYIEKEMNSKQIAKETDKDPLLRKVKNFLLHGWPTQVESSLMPYFRRRDCLSLNKDCVMLANRVVIPEKLQEQAIKILHEGHGGIVQTKMLARAYIWFPSMDTEIERKISKCDACQLNRNNPPETRHEWPATKAWSRLHVDFMGPFMGKTFLVVVDAYSKWPVVEIMTSMSSIAVVNTLRRIFADFGLPDIVVSDNGLAFTSREFQIFMQKNQIKHLTGAPYHPATNGQAERMIQTIKSKFKKQSNMPWSERVAKMLFQMRTVLSTITEKSPAELLMGRRFRTALSVLHPDLDYTKNVEKEVERNREGMSRREKLRDGDNVLLRMYNGDEKWKRGIIVGRPAPSVYEVRASDGIMHRRHVDQLLRTRPPRDSSPTQALTPADEEYLVPETDTDNESIVIPPPEEWPDIIGC